MAEDIREKSNLAGRKFGRLTVISFAEREKKVKGTRLFWLCECECGTRKVILSGALRKGKIKSCGTCAKPGGLRTEWPGYSSLKAARARCENPKQRAYKDYGGRGIQVCDRWRNGEGGKTGFECFFDDMGPRPQGMTIDRIDTDGNYEPGNCRWAGKKQQQQNQRRGIYAIVGGVKVPLKKYVARTGLCYETIRFIVRKRGLSVGEAARGVLARAA